MKRAKKTVVVRVPIELRNAAKGWQRLLGSDKEIDGWNQIKKIHSAKSKKIYPDTVFRI